VPPAPAPSLYIAHLTPGAALAAVKLGRAARLAGLQVVVAAAGRSLKAQMRHADAKGAAFAAIIGADELASGEATLRNLADHSERRVRLDDLPSVIIG